MLGSVPHIHAPAVPGTCFLGSRCVSSGIDGKNACLSATDHRQDAAKHA